MGKLVAIFIASAARQPMRSLEEAELVPGRGILGDRYYAETGTFSEKLKGKRDSEVTLVESEQVVYFNRETGHSLSNGDLRRNLVTQGISLNELVGRRFRVGEAMLEGIRLCEPCAHLASMVAPEVLPVLVHRAGLRAQIIEGGAIRPNDDIDIVA